MMPVGMWAPVSDHRLSQTVSAKSEQSREPVLKTSPGGARCSERGCGLGSRRARTTGGAKAHALQNVAREHRLRSQAAARRLRIQLLIDPKSPDHARPDSPTRGDGAGGSRYGVDRRCCACAFCGSSPPCRCRQTTMRHAREICVSVSELHVVLAQRCTRWPCAPQPAA